MRLPIGFFLVLLCGCPNPSPSTGPAKTTSAASLAEPHAEVVTAVKNRLNDPDSFKLLELKRVDPDSVIFTKSYEPEKKAKLQSFSITFTANNKFGAKATTTVYAWGNTTKQLIVFSDMLTDPVFDPDGVFRNYGAMPSP